MTKLNEDDNMKHLIIGTAGHVDHGKTSLVKLLTGTDCDTHQQERQRGITINLGFTHLELPNGESAGIIDVPGHKDFINTMIGGACGINMVLLVIAADSGIMPQTIEHMEIIHSLGVNKGVIALTRADLVDAELLEMAEYEVTGFLEGTPLQHAPIVPVSSVTGMGKDMLLQAIADTLDTVEPRPTGSLFRMYIDRIFTVKGHGSVVTGSVLNGSVTNGAELFLLPSDQQKLRVRSMERHGQQVNLIVAGDRAAMNLTGLNRKDFDRGMILCDKPIDTTDMVDATISLYAFAGTLPHWSNIVFISGTFACQARMHLLDKDAVQGGEKALVQIHLGKPAVLMNKDHFIIRNSSEDKTLGGGIILETSPLHHRKRTTELIEELKQLTNHILEGNSLSGMIHVLLKKSFRPMTSEEVREKLSADSEEFDEALRRKEPGFKIWHLNDTAILINEQCHKMFATKVIELIQEYHNNNPLFAEGLNYNELAGKLGLPKSTIVKNYLLVLLTTLKNEKKIEELNNTFILQGHQPKFDQQSLAEITWLEKEILAYADNKPVLADIEIKAESQRIQKHKIKTYLSWLAANGKLKFFKSDFIHIENLHHYRNLLIDYLKDKENGITISELKEIITGTKKFRTLLIEILESEKRIRLNHDAEETIISIVQ